MHRAAAQPRTSTGAWLTVVRECGYCVEEPNQAVPKGFCETQSRSEGPLGAAPRAHTSNPRRHLTSVTEAAAMKVVFETRGPRRCQPGLARAGPARRCRRARSD